ncbi:hypothetical protein Pint_00528 [Pistacia integerrima]|uniref:Uncharacterized protein n=1 Tax=Pistacia integerrima TaxID=434235 RepID=A0ACC0ZJS1_9ROSI|nr:hypothetical protein Pint_00528 [Pistacia integerrima]
MKGTILASLGQLSSLVALDINYNQWEGVMTEAHFSSLTSLKDLSIVQSYSNITLVFNVSSEWIPTFKLKYLNLKSCLVGPKFPMWLRNQNELNSVAIWHDNISDTKPDWFWKLDLFLDVLDFSYNQLNGKIPNTIKFGPNAVVFLNYNQFTGPLPVFSSNITSFHLDNFFSGPIPEDFDFWSSLTAVYVINVANNYLTGEIPSSLGNLGFVSPIFLTLSNNQLSGEITSALKNCTEITTPDLGDNKLSGSIPAWIRERFPSLLILRSIPPCLGNLSGISVDAENVRYEGQLLVATKGREYLYDTGNLYLVNSIDLSSSSLRRELPDLTNLSRLGILNLSMNHLTGKVPESIGSLKQLEREIA